MATIGEHIARGTIPHISDEEVRERADRYRAREGETPRQQVERMEREAYAAIDRRARRA